MSKCNEPKGEMAEEDIAQRRDKALKRALSTPPKPHKPAPKKKEAKSRRS